LALQKLIEDLNKELDNIKIQVANKESIISKKDCEIHELKGLNSYKDRCIDLSKQVETLELEIHSLKIQIDEKDTIITDLNAQLKNNILNSEKEQEWLKNQSKLENEIVNLKENSDEIIKKLKEEFNLKSKNNEGDLEARLKSEFEQELLIRLNKAKKN